MNASSFASESERQAARNEGEDGGEVRVNKSAEERSLGDVNLLKSNDHPENWKLLPYCKLTVDNQVNELIPDFKKPLIQKRPLLQHSLSSPNLKTPQNFGVFPSPFNKLDSNSEENEPSTAETKKSPGGRKLLGAFNFPKLFTSKARESTPSEMNNCDNGSRQSITEGKMAGVFKNVNPLVERMRSFSVVYPGAHTSPPLKRISVSKILEKNSVPEEANEPFLNKSSSAININNNKPIEIRMTSKPLLPLNGSSGSIPYDHDDNGCRRKTVSTNTNPYTHTDNQMPVPDRSQHRRFSEVAQSKCK